MNAVVPACVESNLIQFTSNKYNIDDSSLCTPLCQFGYHPNEQNLTCSLGILTPATFTCLESPCIAPLGVENAVSISCAEGASIPSKTNCTTQCQIGYHPTTYLLVCDRTLLTPPSFLCLADECYAPLGI